MKDEIRKRFFILHPSSLKIKTPLVLGQSDRVAQLAAWRTVHARKPRAHSYGAPLGIDIPRMKN